MSHNPDNIHLPHMPLPPELPPDGDFVLSAPEIRVLIKAAARLMAEEIADALAARAKVAQRMPAGERSGVREGMVVTWLAAEKLARDFTKENRDG